MQNYAEKKYICDKQNSLAKISHKNNGATKTSTANQNDIDMQKCKKYQARDIQN